MSDVYSERSYGEIEVGFGDRIGILVVDFQLGFTDARFRMGGSEHIERAVSNTMRLLEATRLWRSIPGLPITPTITCLKNGAHRRFS